MRNKVIFIIAFFALLIQVWGCGPSRRPNTRIHATASFRQWRYYKNYHHFSFWRHPRRGGGGYYYKPRHRHNLYPHRSPTSGWFDKRGYSK